VRREADLALRRNDGFHVANLALVIALPAGAFIFLRSREAGNRY
jgi:hypothetical protein